MKSYKRITINKKQKRLHRYVMECWLGRELNRNELVHHKNADIQDNNINNLMLITRSEHLKVHSNIGIPTRFKKIYNIDINDVMNKYKYMSLFIWTNTLIQLKILFFKGFLVA